MSVAVLFPGQGSETPGMGGRELLRSAPVREWLERASAIVGLDVIAAVQDGSPALRRTDVAQAALTAVGLGLFAALTARGLQPDNVAGHSVGELAAFAAAGVCDPGEAVELAAERGRLMAAAAEAAPGGMLAIPGASANDVREALALGALAGRIEIAAQNAPDEIVLTGDRAALAAVAARFTAVLLPVAGPWHSSAMADAERGFRRVLEDRPLRPPTCGLVVNRDGRLVGADTNLADVLAGQLTRPIAWVMTMRTLLALGTRTWVIIGPGRRLRGLVRKNVDSDPHVVLVQHVGDLEAVAA